MSNTADQFQYGTSGFLGHQEKMERPVLSQSSSLSTQDSGTMNTDYSNPMMVPQGQHAYHLQDSTMSGQMLSPVPSHTPEWWPPHAMMPTLDTSIDMMADFGMSQSAGATASPALHDEYGARRTSVSGNPEIAEWQEKVRVERRKVQNRAAQRAYRERKDKAILDLRELLEQRDSQYQALQADHKELQEQYEKLQAAKNDTSTLSMTTTCAPADLFANNIRGDHAHAPKRRGQGRD